MKRKIDNATVNRWRQTAISYLLMEHGLTPAAIEQGRDAWSIAHKLGWTREAYDKLDAYDAHIQTALGYIFPNVIFRDAKRY